MKKLLTIIIFVFISGCSVQVVEMAAQPTKQKFDLSDDDNDGVISAREQCNSSLKGVKVNNNGCGLETPKVSRIKLLINFASNSYEVKPEFFGEINRLADFMKENPKTSVTIEGHTSMVGSRALNQRLSENRALAVKNILETKFGIDKSRVKAIGYGFDRLLQKGNSEAINARNRRIVAEITAEKEIKDLKWTIYSVDDPVE